jgi:flagellar protein FlaG
MASDFVTAAVVQTGRVTGISGTGQSSNAFGREEAVEAVAVAAPVQPMARAQLERAVAGLNEAAQSYRRSLRFSVDEDSGRTVIRVVDPETDEVVRQIPPEEVLNVARRMGDSAGALLQAEA